MSAFTLGYSLGLLTLVPVLLAAMWLAHRIDRRTRAPEPDTAGRIELVDDEEVLTP